MPDFSGLLPDAVVNDPTKLIALQCALGTRTTQVQRALAQVGS